MAIRKPPKITRSGKKINKHATNNLVGLVFVGTALTLIASLIIPAQTFQSSTLVDVRSYMERYFGGFFIAFPFLLLLMSTHFFKFKAFQKIYYRTTGGAFIMFIASLIALQGGELGESLFFFLSGYLSVFGTWIVAIFSFIIGAMFFTNSSLDDVARFFAWFFRGVFGVFGSLKGKQARDTQKDISETEFIKDAKLEARREEHRPVAPVRPMAPVGETNALHMRTYVQTDGKPWVYPDVKLLEHVEKKDADRGDVQKTAAIVERTLDSFGIRAKVAEVNFGPTVTQYALEIAMGTKLSKITTLNNDIALATAAPGGQVRIEAPIPGRSLVGVEIPNRRAEIVTLRNMLQLNAFGNDHDPLLIPLGLDVSGKPVVYSLSKMTHCLIAGTTGSGKSVIVNAWITTFLMRTTPQELQLILIDPKRVELTPYNGIPHLKTEVIVEPQKALSALKWCVEEMERRYRKLQEFGVRSLPDYNNKEGIDEPMPYLVVIIDELADLMMTSGKEVESAIVKIAQKARAVGIHLILATQRPSTDVITGLMKANIPTRLAFNVPSQIDSRVIIDMPGAENLVGKGDMLFLPPDSSKPRRIQGPLVVTKEIARVVEFLKQHYPEVNYTTEITEMATDMGGDGIGSSGELDPMYHRAVEEIMNSRKASASFLQRRLGIGYNRAAKILDQMQEAGLVGPSNGSKPREILRQVE